MLNRPVSRFSAQATPPALGWNAARKVNDVLERHEPLKFGEFDAGISLIRAESAAHVGEQAATLVTEQLRQKPASIIVFPTGNTPKPMYEFLRRTPAPLWRDSHLFHLDEYIYPEGVSPKAERYADYMKRELWGHVPGVKHYLADRIASPEAYEAELLALGQGGPDLVILGIGTNGHIAFNEPNASPESLARVVNLSASTQRANFKENAGKPGYPVRAVTMGLKTILRARHILLLATGQDKRDIVRRALNPATPPDPAIPASWLKMHPNVTVLTDFAV